MLFRIFASFTILSLPVAALAQNDAAVNFGSRASIEHASLSPDGSRLAYLQPTKGQGSGLFIVPIDGSAKPFLAIHADGDPERLDYCRWAAASRLVCEVYGITQIEGGYPARISRLIAIDADGKNMKTLFDKGGTGDALGYKLYGGEILDWLPDEDGKVLMMREYVPETSTATHLAQTEDGFGVVRVDTRNLSSSIVERPRRNSWEYISDGRGEIRIQRVVDLNASDYETGKARYNYRSTDSRDWKPLASEDIAGFVPHGVDPDLNVAYGLQKLDGRSAAYKVSLDGSMKKELVFAHPNVDVAGFVRIGRRGRIIGVSYVTDRREVHYFDPTLAKLATSLSKAIPNLPLVQIVDSSVDEQKLLIWAGSDTDPGRYFLFDRQAKQLEPLFYTRPQLGKVPLSPVKAMTYGAADGTKVPGYLTLPPGKTSARGLPAIVMPHGGPGARDEWGFDWLPQYFANRGYAVLQPNFRGSAGYGDAWFQKNGFQNWQTAIGDINDGGRWLISEGVDPKKLAVFGWSYGGYAALQSGATDPGLFQAIVAVAPVTDLAMLKEQSRIWSNYRLVSNFVGDGPHIEQGSPARKARNIKAPVLMFHGTYDRNVGVNHSRVMADRLKDAGAKAEYVEYSELDHYLDDSEARIDMLTKSDAFLQTALGLN